MSCGCPLRKAKGADHVCAASCRQFRGCSGACHETEQIAAAVASAQRGPQLLGSRCFNIRELEQRHPVRFKCRNKVRLHEEVLRIVQPLPESARLCFHRFRAGRLPRRFGKGCEARVLPGLFDYQQSTEAEVHWYVNFAATELFGFYEGSLFAQDEMQVQEHPALGSLRRALQAAAEPGLVPLTVQGSSATPCLVAGVPRVCSIDTAPSAAAPLGLFGSAFAGVLAEEVIAATRFHEPPLTSNILAIEAPKPGRGTYTWSQVNRIIEAAYAGYAAAKTVSSGALAEGGTGQLSVEVVVHTGHWGCGAYGGSRPLMAMLQTVAAQLAGVSLVYHAFDAAGIAAVEGGMRVLRELEEQLDSEGTGSVSLDAFVREVEARGFAWGQSDGN